MAFDVAIEGIKEFAQSGPVAEFFRNLFDPEVFDMKVAAAADGVGAATESTQVADAETLVQLDSLGRLIDDLQKELKLKLFLIGDSTYENVSYLVEKSDAVEDMLWDLQGELYSSGLGGEEIPTRFLAELDDWHHRWNTDPDGSIQEYYKEFKDICGRIDKYCDALEEGVERAKQVS